MTQQSFLPVHLGGETFLLNADLVQEVIGERKYVKVPHATQELPGVFAWKGRAIPLVDLSLLLHLESTSQEGHRWPNIEPNQATRPRTVVVRVLEEWVGLKVDGAREVIRLNREELLPVHASPHPYASAEVKSRGSGGLWTVLNVDALVSTLLQLSQPQQA